MRFSTPILRGRLLRRYQRFFADVELDDGRVVVAHCPNTGTMKTCLEPGTRAWITKAARPGRKLEYTWEVAEQGSTLIYVNPAGANTVVAEAVQDGTIPELAGYTGLRREVKYGESSRIDLLLERAEDRCYVEVKNVTLLVGPGCAAFPDAVTERGRKHLEELMRVAQGGQRAVLFFCLARTDCSRFEPADAIDPKYGRALRQAVAHGVEVLAYGVTIHSEGIHLGERRPVVIE